MEWQLFAISQMALIAIGLSTAFFLHARTLGKQNNELRNHVDALEAAPKSEETHPSPREWTKEHLATIPEDNPGHALIKAVLRNAVRPKDDFLDKLPDVLSKAGFAAGEGSDETSQARIKELEAQLATAQAGAGEAPNEDQSSELKALLQQFTNDSREMMACIQQLETENAELKKQLDSLNGGTAANETSAEDLGATADTEVSTAQAEESAA